MPWLPPGRIAQRSAWSCSYHLGQIQDSAFPYTAGGTDWATRISMLGPGTLSSEAEVRSGSSWAPVASACRSLRNIELSHGLAVELPTSCYL